MDFQTSVKTCLTEKYMDFSGRASRSEFWWFMLAYIIGALVVSLFPLLPLIYALGMFLPLLAVGFRRMHDTGRPGWYFLIPSIYNLLVRIFGFGRYELDPQTGMPLEAPSVGGAILGAILGIVGLVIAIIFIWWLTRPSEPDANEYGAPPAA
ncbi:Inner membrane protein YhaI [Roseovarius sp. THAF9]|uniref:DUF805 domain-containing protein n=1 Tax=Roseovarius sp. THAF9 TaxID=2587847 RepID=UPI001267F292|nr:DUF805 domain-containing protein [Roseovarius sp. THAF9]QFT91496.1 Inner membrane protein YhaI [Roseovarius sp. THAF9]